ncbi:DUF4234 domain-containing protein [Modestobacter muralis]|nr:DUF4234 domain-containing protein [Modestobacter muralis]
MSALEEPSAKPTYAPAPQPPMHYAPQQAEPASYGMQAPGAMQLHPMHAGVAPYGRPLGPVGKVRSTWAVIGLTIITLGLYSLYYHFATHEEMKQHSGEGVGGAVGLVLAIFTLGLVTPFVLPNEVGNLYARQGRPRPVSATTGLWVLLGSFILIGPLVWLIKSNGALNAYWRSMGAV